MNKAAFNSSSPVSYLNCVLYLPLPLSICTWFLTFFCLKYQLWWTGFFFLVWTGFLQATKAVKIRFKLGEKSSSSTRNFKLDNVKNQVQIDRISNSFDSKVHDLWFNWESNGNRGWVYQQRGVPFIFFPNNTVKIRLHIRLFGKIIKGGKRALLMIINLVVCILNTTFW